MWQFPLSLSPRVYTGLMKIRQSILGHLKQCLVENPIIHISNGLKHDKHYAQMFTEEIIKEAPKDETMNSACHHYISWECKSWLPCSKLWHSTEWKGEVDHVVGLAKSAIWRAVGTGEFFAGASNVIEYLQMKCDGHSDLVFHIKEIDELWIQNLQDMF